MRHYQCNSPEAAGRILAACLLTDGHLSITELEVLDRCGMERRLLLNRHRLLSIVQTLYEDLTRCGYLSWSDVCHVDPATLEWLAADVQRSRHGGPRPLRSRSGLPEAAARRVATSGRSCSARCATAAFDSNRAGIRKIE
jgi:hypothetical protein